MNMPADAFIHPLLLIVKVLLCAGAAAAIVALGLLCVLSFSAAKTELAMMGPVQPERPRRQERVDPSTAPAELLEEAA